MDSMKSRAHTFRLGRRFATTGFLVVALLAGVAVLASLANNRPVAAISDWQAGYIISDGAFTNKNSMSADAIQGFLESKVPSCDTWGTQVSEFGGGTRRQWAEARGYSPPYTCLRDYVDNGKRASQIIYDVAQQFSINPQVLIVLLQKEQSLVTDTWPLSLQYRSATGYGCPDTAPCDSQYYGLTNQLTWAARMFRAIMNASPTWYTPYVVGNNYILYNPDASCGGSTVNIQNRATQALYNYTPYQPNQGALNAGWGTASCGAYGNRNFYLYYTSWFGSTRYETFEPMSEPRVMEWAQSAYKISPYTGVKASDSYPAGMQRLFKSKAWTENGWCLRTEYDESIGSGTCILMSNLTDDIFEYVDLAPSEQVKSFMRYGCRLNLRTQVINNSDCFDTGREVTFAKKVFIIDQWYLVSQANIQQGTPEIGFRMSAFKVVPYKEDIEPRFMTLTESTPKYNVATSDSATGETYPTGLTRKFVTVYRDENNTEFYQTETDAGWLMARGFPADSLEVAEFVSFTDPRELTLTQNSCKENPFTGEKGLCYGKGLTRRFESKILFDGVWYYRTQTDTGEDNSLAFPAYSLGEV